MASRASVVPQSAPSMGADEGGNPFDGDNATSSSPAIGRPVSAPSSSKLPSPLATPSPMSIGGARNAGAGGGGAERRASSAIVAGSTSSNAVGLASWLRLNKKEDEGGNNPSRGRGGDGVDEDPVGGGGNGARTAGASGAGGDLERKLQLQHLVGGKITTATPTADARTKSRRPRAKKKCKSFVTPWPFDNYHEVQEAMYEELASRAASEYGESDNNRGGGGGLTGYASGGDDDEKKDDRSRRAHGRGNKGGGGGRMMNGEGGGGNGAAVTYERPDELPSIKEAVVDLPLIEFEKKAEERAINIVSTWLFDAGLIDELLVNGATVPSPQQKMSSSATIMSEKTSEGQELGAHGFLVGVQGADLKIDKETNKLRALIQRDLSIINARLNDGVAASGLEVKELVNAVVAAKEDIGRLRELTTYISDGQHNSSSRDEFLLAKYPYLRKAINARRNINRCFRELDFFSHIPSTCERLRDDLHSGEWTAEEWSTIRNVSMEHVELEVMLVEAEDSMKSGAHNFNDAVVDSFLEAHVQNVWELGEEIRMRIISGIGTAFELSINNPSGMVALVEAVEVYERAAESFERKRIGRGGGDNRLRFTNMRAAALEQLYQDFELRGVDMFRGVHEHVRHPLDVFHCRCVNFHGIVLFSFILNRHIVLSQAADLAEEEDAANVGFTAILKAATELVTEIDIVKHQMSPCFAPHWHVEALWSSCVAHVCSNHIVQQIGGPDGQNLPDLTITQLLELVAWVEYFRETIEETFPEVASMRNTKKTYFEERPELFAGDKRTVNMKNARESLAWVNNMLWEVHRLAQEEFLVRTRSQTDEWLDKVSNAINGKQYIWVLFVVSRGAFVFVCHSSLCYSSKVYG